VYAITKAAFLALLMLATSLCQSPSKPSQARNWEETDSETLWRNKYAHCDYGFYVVLPRGFVGHGLLSPSSNHGFLVALPDVGRTQNATSDDERFIWVNAGYNSLELKSLSEVVDYYSDLIIGRHKKGFKRVAREPVRLDGRAAIRIRVEYDGPSGKVIEEETIILRSGIIYEAGLVTTPKDYASDRARYSQVLAGFRFWRIHYC
jgi:hypothetical protein